MSEILRIFISATHDLEAQRSVIGRTLAELPVQVGAEIRRYPPEGVSNETLFELIGNVDRVYFLMGGDITAPAGAEWDLALRLERSLMALRYPARLTPAAQQFLRTASNQIPADAWRIFRTDAELARIVGLDLVDLLLHPRNRYGVSLAEIQALQRHRQALQKGAESVDPEPGGAGAGAVILCRGNISI